jgi:hypothetical protein
MKRPDYEKDGDPNSYHYDLETIAWASVGIEVTPSISRRWYDGHRGLWPLPTGNDWKSGRRAFRSLVGCLDAYL